MLKISTVAAALLAAAGASHAAIPANISFDGFCDGLVNLHVNGGFVTGAHDFSSCGAGLFPNSVMGPTGRTLAGATGRGYALTEASFAQSNLSYGWVINNDHTWTLYEADTGLPVAEGTWSAGYPLAGAQGTRRITTSLLRK